MKAHGTSNPIFNNIEKFILQIVLRVHYQYFGFSLREWFSGAGFVEYAINVNKVKANLCVCPSHGYLSGWTDQMTLIEQYYWVQ